MGTRADFYVGKDKDAEWIGSIAWDGYRSGIDANVLNARSEVDFRGAVARFFLDRDDVTLPTRGWPWPWKTSATTDCSYWFFNGQVWDERGNTYQSCLIDKPETDEAYASSVQSAEKIDFPVFDDRPSAEAGSNRSGIIVL